MGQIISDKFGSSLHEQEGAWQLNYRETCIKVYRSSLLANISYALCTFSQWYIGLSLSSQVMYTEVQIERITALARA